MPSEAQIVAAVREITAERDAQRGWPRGATCNMVARRLGVVGFRRDALEGGPRLASRLAAMRARGVLERRYDRQSRADYYTVVDA